MTISFDVTQFQHEYVTSEAKYNVLVAGRRAGKTHAEICRMVSDSLQNPGFRTLFLTPDGSLLHEVFRTIITNRVLVKRIAKVEKQPARQIFFTNGSIIYMRPFDQPDRSVGFGFDHVLFDEIQKLNSVRGKSAFMQALRPLIMDRKGKMTVSGQWRGEACWWYKWWQEQTDSGERHNPDFRMWSIPSWEGVKFRDGRENHPEILDARMMMTPQLFDQDIACIPSGNANAAFNFYDIKDCTKGGMLDKGEDGRTYVIGADLGKVVDPSAWVVMDVKDKAVVHAELRKLGEKHSIGALKLNELSARFNGARVIIDATGGATGGKKHKDIYVREYRKYVKNLGKVIMTPQVKEDLIGLLNLGFQNSNLTIPEDAKTLLAQLSSYEAVPNTWGGFRYMGPNGHDDDLVIGLAIAYDAIDRGRVSSGNDSPLYLPRT